MARYIKNASFEAVFEQDCSDYLRSLGVNCSDGVGINAPYRPGADSESFHTYGVFFRDFSHGTSGNVWQLAMLMHDGDRKKALESLQKSAGVVLDSVTQGDLRWRHDSREETALALEKVRQAFPISKAPEDVRKYVAGRMVTDQTVGFLSYVPEGQLSTVLTEAEANATGLKYRENLLILWYFVGGKPVYYCTRSPLTKEFKKAPTENLPHPIWNYDDLYTSANVVWGEGMFDVLSLKELGYGVAGEITCNPASEHRDALEKALWWRTKNHPDWEFVICLDNDELTASGHRPGNEAAERLARQLFAAGLDVKWVQHVPGSKKIDINQLHQEGKAGEIHKMLQSAKRLSEIFGGNKAQCALNFTICMNEGDYLGAQRFLKLLELSETGEKLSLKAIADMYLGFRMPWRHYYPEIQDMAMWEDTVYTVLRDARDGKAGTRCESFKKANVIDNLRQYQKNPAFKLKWEMVDIPSRRPYFKVKRKKTPEDEYMFNMFQPSPLLFTERREGYPGFVPSQWELLLNNIAGPGEVEWLLNHLATYFQTLEKPRTIPVLVGPQGNGKNTLFQLFGEAIGGYVAIGNDILEKPFNDWMEHPVVLLDEFFTDSKDSRQLKSKLKGLINSEQSIHRKYQNVFPCEVNNWPVQFRRLFVISSRGCSPFLSSSSFPAVCYA